MIPLTRSRQHSSRGLYLDLNEDRLGLSKEEWEALIREAAELAVNRKNRAMTSGMFQDALTHLIEQQLPKRICMNCGKLLGEGRRKRYCSKECWNSFWYKFSWQWLRDDILIERNCCERCGMEREIPWEDRYLIHDNQFSTIHESPDFFYTAYGPPLWEIHHIQPVNAHGGEGKIFDPDNLSMLCVKCHDIVHAELWKDEISNRPPKNHTLFDYETI